MTISECGLTAKRVGDAGNADWTMASFMWTRLALSASDTVARCAVLQRLRQMEWPRSAVLAGCRFILMLPLMGTSGSGYAHRRRHQRPDSTEEFASA